MTEPTNQGHDHDHGDADRLNDLQGEILSAQTERSAHKAMAVGLIVALWRIGTGVLRLAAAAERAEVRAVLAAEQAHQAASRRRTPFNDTPGF